MTALWITFWVALGGAVWLGLAILLCLVADFCSRTRLMEQDIADAHFAKHADEALAVVDSFTPGDRHWLDRQSIADRILGT